jgi:Protein of unknown function (DUF3716)
LYNAAAAAGQVAQVPTLRVAGQQLAPLIHSRRGLAVLAMAGRDVQFVPGGITPEQVFFLQRPSYINAILIQSRGIVRNPPCDRCAVRMYPFLECRRVPGHFGGCCGNCKWPDAAASCSAKNDDDDDDDSDVEFTGVRAIEGPGSAAAPIVVD